MAANKTHPDPCPHGSDIPVRGKRKERRANYTATQKLGVPRENKAVKQDGACVLGCVCVGWGAILKKWFRKASLRERRLSEDLKVKTQVKHQFSWQEEQKKWAGLQWGVCPRAQGPQGTARRRGEAHGQRGGKGKRGQGAGGLRRQRNDFGLTLSQMGSKYCNTLGPNQVASRQWSPVKSGHLTPLLKPSSYGDWL